VKFFEELVSGQSHSPSERIFFLNETGLFWGWWENSGKGGPEVSDGTKEDMTREKSISGYSSKGVPHRVQHDYRVWQRKRETDDQPLGVTHPPASHSFPAYSILDGSLSLRLSQSDRPDLSVERERQVQQGKDFLAR
jgi:hypothetical protein